MTEVFGEKDGWRVWDQAPSGTWEKVVTPADGEVFWTDQQPTYHAHGVLWGIEFLLAPAPKPSSEGTAKWQKHTILGAWLQVKGEVQGQGQAPEAPPPLPKLGMHCVVLLIIPLFGSDVCNLCCPSPCNRPHLLGSTGGTWEWEHQRR